MSYDPNLHAESSKMSCERQVELAKQIAEQETSKLRYTILNPACSRYTQIADRGKEHDLTLGNHAIQYNNALTRVTPQVSILDFPQYNIS